MKALHYLSLLYFITLIRSHTSVPCKLYPKILGGSSGFTMPTAMDANLAADKIVVGGYSYDSGIGGVTFNG
jgi:hypothetical protein